MRVSSAPTRCLPMLQEAHKRERFQTRASTRAHVSDLKSRFCLSKFLKLAGATSPKCNQGLSTDDAYLLSGPCRWEFGHGRGGGQRSRALLHVCFMLVLHGFRIQKHQDATFLLTVGSFLLTVELLCSQLCLGLFAYSSSFFPYCWSFFAYSYDPQ